MEDTLHQFEATIARSLLSAAGSSVSGNMSATSYLGPPQIMHAAIGVNWFAISVCVASLLFYAFHYSKQYTGWEEVYVCIVELVKVTLEIFAEQYAPATITTVDGKHVAWLRYAEWLLTCPVILIHMSNITGLHSEYNKRTMTLLVTDIGCIVMGVAAAFASGYVKVIFYLLGCVYACIQFLNSAKVYMQAYKEVPPGKCQDMIKILAYLFFASWMAFPLLFLVGPEGFGQITVWGAVMGHTIADLFAKNLWGLLAHHLRIMIAMEIIAGWDPDTHEQSREKGGIEQQPGNLLMDNSVRNSGEEPGVVAILKRMNSLGTGKKDYSDDSAYKTSSNGPVRVILAVTTNDMIDYFQGVVSALTVPLEVTSAIGESALIQLAHDTTPTTTDAVLVPAEFCSVSGRDGIVAKLKALGYRVVAYGWTASIAESIEAWDIDGYVEGPSWGKGINAQQFALTLVQMQEKRIRASQAAQGGGMTRTFSNTNFTASNPLYSNSAGAGSPVPPAGGAVASRTSPLGRKSPVGAIARSLSKSKSITEGRNSPMTPAALTSDFGGQVRTSSPGGITNSNVIGVYNPPRSPRATTAVSPSRISGSNQDLLAMASAAGVRANANLSETEMLQQLMGEISRLKKELGE